MLRAIEALLIYEQVMLLDDEIAHLRRRLRFEALFLYNRVTMAMMTVCFILRLFSSRTLLVRHAHSL